MLENIKSIYFLKFIFKSIDEKSKLNIVKYNSKLQNKIDINLNNYKFFSRRYIVYEKNGIAKEYNILTNRLIFVGEYSNGKRNGKGKEYDEEGFLRYEGGYKSGKRNGKGKEEEDWDKFFEGDFLNGKKWNGIGSKYGEKVNYELKNGQGIVKEYNHLGHLIYEGEYLNGLKNGKGKEYNHKVLCFEGEYLNGEKWNGKIYYDNSYSELRGGKGFIKEFNSYTDILFEGEYLNGKRNGRGKEYKYGRLIYEGEYLKGQRNGKGKEYKDDKLIFEGEYLYGERIKGKIYINGILEFEGEYLLGKKWTGKGYDENNNLIYELNNGNGSVREYDNIFNHLIYEGEYLNGKKNGKVKEYENGYLVFIGEYLNGEKNGKAKEYTPYFKPNLFNDKLVFGKKNSSIINPSILQVESSINESNRNMEEYLSSYKPSETDLIFEGEYLNGKKHGKVKEYEFGKIKFEGEYLNGQRNGKGKEYNKDNGYYIFEGEYKDNYKSKGKEYYDDGKLKFDGEYFCGKIYKGKLYVNGYLEYEGEFKNEKKWNGKGYDKNHNLIYELINGNGTVKEYNENYYFLIFEGEYLNGQKNGKGKEYYGNGNLFFEGEYLNGQKNGKGKEYSSEGELIYEGEYLNGKKVNAYENLYNVYNDYYNPSIRMMEMFKMFMNKNEK